MGYKKFSEQEAANATTIVADCITCKTQRLLPTVSPSCTSSYITLLLFVISILLSIVPTQAQQLEIRTDKGENYYGNESVPVLSGQVTAPTAQELTLRTYRDYITFQEDIYTAKMHRDGSFAFLNIKIERPTVGLLSYNGERIEVYLEPNNQQFMTFDGRQFLPTLAFSGTGSAHNNYLVQAVQQFYKNSTESLTYEMQQRGAMDFRAYLDNVREQKLAFYQKKITQHATDYSESFRAFAKADIDYWWGYHLMRYRHESPAAKGLPAPMTLPVPYYDFLDQITVSNESALLNKYYIHFLDAFFAFAKEQPQELRERENLDLLRKVKHTTYGLVTGPFSHPLIIPVQKGAKVQLTQTTAATTEWQPSLYNDSLQVWLPQSELQPYNVEQEEIEVVSTRKVEYIRSRVESYGVVRFDRLQVRKDPYQTPHFATLYEGDKVDIAYNKTKERISYDAGEVRYSDYFIKIRLADGQEGWVLQGAIQPRERIEEVLEQEDIPVSIAPKTYNNACKYLSGEVLHYVLAKDIYQRAGATAASQLRKEIEDLLNISQSTRYNTIAKRAYDHAVNGTTATPKMVALQQLRPDVNVASLEFTETFAKYIPAVQKRNLQPTAHSTVNAAEYAEIELAPNTAATETVRIQAVFPASGTRKLTLVLYKDPVVYQEETYYLDAQDDIVQLSLSEPLTGELRYGEQTLPVYLEPGDDIQLKFDPVQFEQSLTFEGRGAANNNYLKANRSALRKIQKDVNTNVRYANPTDYRKFMDEQYASRKAFLTNFPQREEWSAAFTTFAQADIDYWYGFYLLNYAWEHPLYNDQATPMSLPASYYDFTHKLALNKDGILTNKYYSFYLEQYIAYQLDQADNQGMSELDLAKMHLNGESYYYYQTKLLVASCRRGQAKEAGWVIKDFVKKCPYPVFNQVLSDTYHHARGLVEGTNAPDFTLTDVNGQQVSLSDYKGKVVFIDFWATWCAPCIRYMRHTQRMAQQFANDDVVFLYISLDRDKQNWEQQVNLKNLHGVHLTAGNGSGYQSHIAQLYRVKRLPTYVLIDRDGKVAISPENMPSTAQLTGAISRLLTQN